jgi:dipeptidyl aminopeptidase/acylaminoacyl peptidase
MATSPVRSGALAALALALGLGCGSEPPGSASAGLVFVRRHGLDRNAPRDLAWARIADGHVEVLETPQTEEMWPYYSPEARLVVFSRGRLGMKRGRLWLWDPASGEQRPATNGTKRFEALPDWSPRGSLLAYDSLWRWRGGIQLLDVATGRSVQVATTTAKDDHYLRPVFGPRPELLVAQRNHSGQSDLYLLREGAAPEPLLVDAASNDEKPVFRRDGGAVFFSRMPVGGGRMEIAEIDLATRAVRIVAPVADADQHTVNVSPTRDEIAFVRESDAGADLWLMGLPDGEPRNLTNTPRWNEYAPHWSPDGERIALTGNAADDPASFVRVVDRSGALLFESSGYAPDWMPPPVAAPPPR